MTTCTVQNEVMLTNKSTLFVSDGLEIAELNVP